ncbi:unnamed protein product [Paramecium octaurelia]|uniref:Transmembrane protein n=1 Tax=Paramecium octaurelia TaxID=43137 RepID=A0A8S1XE05_PAROT|nr:unnamed protein product [Paramecium octaurelia]
MQFIICFVVQGKQSNTVPAILLLLAKLAVIQQQIHNNDYNSWYNLSISNFVISYILVFLTNQFWKDLVLIHILLITLLKCLRQSKCETEAFQNKNLTYFQYTILKNPQMRSSLKDFSLFFKILSENKISNYQEQIIKEGQFEERFAIINHVYQLNQIQLYLNLIKIHSEELNWFQKTKLEASLLNTIQSSQKAMTSSLNVRQFIQALDVEQQNLWLLINLIDLKCQFYNFLIKEQPLYQYLQNFKKQFDKLIYALEKFKGIFEDQYDLESGKMKSSNTLDYISIYIISSFEYIFYGNYFKAKELEKKQNEVSALDKIMNLKFQRNEAFLVSTSVIRNSYTILNSKNKRLMLVLEQETEPKLISDFLPPFSNSIYNNLVSNYLQSGFNIKQPCSLSFLRYDYLVECDFYINAQMSKDDIVLQNYFVLKNQPNHLLVFDNEGKILGITCDIYAYLIQKSDNAYTKNLSVQQFLRCGMIQYYLPEIYKFIQDLAGQPSSVNSQQILNIASRWDFPINHKKCLDSTQNLLHQSDEQSRKSVKKKPLYHQTWKKQQSQVLLDENITIQNVLVKLMQKQLIQQIQNLVVPSSRMKSIEFEGSLEFVKFKQVEGDSCYFVLRFKQIEDYSQDKAQKIVQEYQFYSSLTIDEQQYEDLQIDYEFIRKIINQKTFNNSLKYNIIILLFMIIITIIALIINYTLNYEQMIYYQHLVNFLTTPQAMTYNIGAAFILMWNQYCIQNKLYLTSPYLEQRRETQLVGLFEFWNQVQEEYTMKLNIKSVELGMNNISLISFENNIKSTAEIDFYSFYAIMRESMVRQFKNTDFNDSTTFDPGILQTNGTIRQNMLQIFKFHHKVQDEVIESTEISFLQFEDQTFKLCIYSSAVILLFLVIFIIINCSLLQKQAKLIRLLQYLNINIIFDQVEVLNFQKEQLQKLLIVQNIQKSNPLTSQQNEKAPLIQTKLNPLSKLDNYDEKYHLLIILSLVIGVQLIFFIFGSQIIAQLYNRDHQDSLILTMKYLKLKTRLDSTIIVGEIIKTEHLLKNNSNINFINETEHILFFFDNVDQLNNLSNNINNELLTVSSYNSSFQEKLIDIFNKDLCLHYSFLLSFCIIDNIRIDYYENENYLTLINKGIFGILQDLDKLAKQDYNYEYINQKYEYNQSHSDYFLSQPIHNHLFQQYFIEIQTCIYLCFLDIFAETKVLSDRLSSSILLYLVTSSVVFLLLTWSIAGFWIYKQYKRCNQLKLIATLFPPALIKQNSFNKLLHFQLLQNK